MEANSNYATVCSPWWSSVFIVAGGPSAHSVNWQCLWGRTVLAVNDAALLVPSATAVFSLDNQWIIRRRAFLESFAGEKYLAVPLDTFPACGGITGARYLQWAYSPGLSTDPTRINTGGNSGYAAINFAYLKRARVIYLAGYDMNTNEDKFAQWIPRFRTMLTQLNRDGVEVWNLNPRSAVDAFPWMSLDESLRRTRRQEVVCRETTRGASYTRP